MHNEDELGYARDPCIEVLEHDFAKVEYIRQVVEDALDG